MPRARRMLSYHASAADSAPYFQIYMHSVSRSCSRRLLALTYTPAIILTACNRIDSTVIFRPLSRATMRKILYKELEDALQRRGLRNRSVAVEWDDVRDRYYWIKEGAKFIRDGTEYNRYSPELHYEVGRIVGQKIGIADEWRIYRRYFNPGGAQYEDLAADEKGDPSPENRGGPDLKLNPEGLDNYLAAQRWYQEANDLEARGYEQYLMMQHIFRQYPYRCQLDYAGTLNREGFFGDVALEAFGPERLMFGGDWPVSTPYGRWARFVTEWSSRLDPGDRDAILWSTAERTYRLSAAA